MNARTVICVAGRRVLEVLAGLGIRVILLDEEIPWDVACGVDLPVECDLTDWQACEQAVRKLLARTGTAADAVISVRDSHVPLAGFLAARLGIAGLPLHAALNCHDKARMRRVLDGAGLPNAKFALALDQKEAVLLADAVGYPLVLKRTRSAGGSAVRLCADAAALASVAAEFTAAGEPAELLAEEYLDGQEYAVQSVTISGQTEILSVFRTHIGPAPRFAEVGYDFPCDLRPRHYGELTRYVERALAAVGLDNAVAHSQVRLTRAGPRLIEINPRPPGGLLAHVSEVVSGVDLVRAAVEAALGEPLTRTAPLASRFRYRCIVFDRQGYLGYDPAALAGPQPGGLTPIVEVDAEPGDLVLAVDHPDGGVYGRIVVFGNDADDLGASFADVLGKLKISLAGQPPARYPSLTTCGA